MDNRDVDKKIATEVMRWKRFPVDGDLLLAWYDKVADGSHDFKYRSVLWQPSTNIAHAIEALDKFGTAWELIKTDTGDYGCDVYLPPKADPQTFDSLSVDFVFGGYQKTPELAICLSLIEAVKGKENA